MTATLAAPPRLDEEANVEVAADDAYLGLIERLSRQSVDKHYDAYADIAWDAPEMQIDPVDPRWELTHDDPLGRTAWYQSLPAETRARIGLHRVATAMKTGLQFENILKRGLLEFAIELPNQSPEFRYAMHEVIEESHHSMMFQEFVNRSGMNPPGLSWDMKLGARWVVLMGKYFPALFFLFVLGGEDPIDFVQRRSLKQDGVHPLLERIMRIHVTEEARHLSFARHYLKHEAPTLGWVKRQRLATATPMLLSQMAPAMLQPSRQMVRQYGIPRLVIKEAYGSAEARQYVLDSLAKVRRLCVELGLVTPLARRLWKAKGIWDEDDTQPRG